MHIHPQPAASPTFDTPEKSSIVNEDANDVFDQSNLYALINNTRDLMWSVDKNYYLITFNNAFDEMVTIMTGAPVRKGDRTAQGFTGAQLEWYKHLYERAFAGETFKVTKHTEILGETWMDISFYPIRKEGDVVGTACYAHDVTEMMVADNALAQSEANLRVIMDLIPQSIFARNYAGKYVFANKSFAALYGLTPSELINKTLVETSCIGEQSEIFLEEDQQVISSGKTTTIIEHPFTDHKGHTGLFATVKVPFTIVGTNEKAVLGVTIDVTEQKKADAERLKMIEDILQRNKDLEQFSYIVSHNLRGPVASMLGVANILEEENCDESDTRELLKGLSLSVRKMDEVIEDLNYILQVKGIERSKKEMVLFPVLISDIKLSIAAQLKKNEVTIATDFSAISGMHTLKSYLYSIFFNLITNSIKYRQAAIETVIEIKSAVADGKIQIVFKDNGMGIDLAKRGDQVFGLYKRFHNHVDGKGMGLYMVKTQVESLGGNITVASTVNAGTAFTLAFAMV